MTWGSQQSDGSFNGMTGLVKENQVKSRILDKTYYFSE